LVGCDINRDRIAAARQAFAGMNAGFRVEDVRSFELPRAELILILDVLQYLTAEEQLVLVARCCSALEPDGKFILRVHDRERGLLSRLSLAFDRIIFFVGRANRKPLMLSAGEYRKAFEGAGMLIEERRFRNRLPLAHLVFIAKKPRLVETMP
jgi:SAM-dependent methyltransferase